MKLFGLLLVLVLLVPTGTFAASKATHALVAVKAARVSAPKARTTARVDYNCSDFISRADAMKTFRAAGGPQKDPYRLDADKDGIPCEELK